MGRSPCCTKEGLNKGAWTAHEDGVLRDYIKLHGEGKWRDVPRRAGLKRCGKSCRLRWLNYLRPDIKRGNFSNDEEDLIIRLHKLLGNRWSLIAGRLPGRTDNEIKNYWNTRIAKKAQERQSKNEKKSMIKPQSLSSSSSSSSSSSEEEEEEAALPESDVVRDINVLGCPKFSANPLKEDIECCKILTMTPYMDGTSSDISSSGVDDINSSDIVIDFNTGEINFPEMVDFDFTMLNDFDLSNMIEGDDGAKRILDQQQLLMLSAEEEMVENWRSIDEEYVEADILGSDFRFLASFLESSSEDWVADA